MESGDPKVSGFQHSFQLRSYLSKRLLHPIVSLEHSWVSLNSAVNVSFCWIPSEINWKCCALFLLLYRKRWPTCDTWAECHFSISLAKVTIVPSGRAWEWSGIWGAGPMSPACVSTRDQLLWVVSSPATDQLLFPGHCAVYRTGHSGPWTQEEVYLWLMQSEVGCSGITGTCIFFLKEFLSNFLSCV